MWGGDPPAGTRPLSLASGWWRKAGHGQSWHPGCPAPVLFLCSELGGHRLGNRAVGGPWGREDLILGPRSGHRTQFSHLRFHHPGPGRLHSAYCDNSTPLSLEARSSGGSQPCAPLPPRRTGRSSVRGKVTACPLPPLEPHSLGWVPHCSPLSSSPGCPVASGASAKRDQLAWGRQGQLCESLKDG